MHRSNALRRVTLALGLAVVPVAAVGAAVSVVLLTEPSRALAQQAEKPKDEVAEKLSPKGLKKGTGGVYAVEEEEKVLKALRDLTDAKKGLAKDDKERTKIQRNINKAKGWISQAVFERRKLNDKIADSPDIGSQNRIIASMNRITEEITKALEYKEKEEKRLKDLGGDAQSKYVDVVLKLHADVEKVEQKYKDLAADPEVTEAIASAKPKAKLGPSQPFVSAAQQIKKLRNDVAAEVVRLIREGNIAWVDVTINGTDSRQMVFDTGSSLICIPADMAKSLEIVAPKDAATIQLTLANGEVVEAKHMQLKSVRVGIFEVKDVDAAILPPSLVAAHPLLGMSYLSNFIMKVDGDELHLARIGAGAAKDEKGKPATASPPAGEKPAAEEPREDEKEKMEKKDGDDDAGKKSTTIAEDEK